MSLVVWGYVHVQRYRVAAAREVALHGTLEPEGRAGVVAVDGMADEAIPARTGRAWGYSFLVVGEVDLPP